MADIKELSEGTVADAEKSLGDLSDSDLQQLHDMEHAKDNPRTTLLTAIHREQDHRKADDEPKPDETAEYRLGRHARKNGIGRAQSPYSKGDARDSWVEGWDFQDSL